VALLWHYSTGLTPLLQCSCCTNYACERHPTALDACREAVAALAASEYISVRVALAESMHCMAALLSPEAVAADLLPVVQVGGTAGISRAVQDIVE